MPVGLSIGLRPFLVLGPMVPTAVPAPRAVAVVGRSGVPPRRHRAIDGTLARVLGCEVDSLPTATGAEI